VGRRCSVFFGMAWAIIGHNGPSAQLPLLEYAKREREKRNQIVT
jgi:hypothetical protein